MVGIRAEGVVQDIAITDRDLNAEPILTFYLNAMHSSKYTG